MRVGYILSSVVSDQIKTPIYRVCTPSDCAFIGHYLGLGHETEVWAVRLVMFLHMIVNVPVLGKKAK